MAERLLPSHPACGASRQLVLNHCVIQHDRLDEPSLVFQGSPYVVSSQDTSNGTSIATGNIPHTARLADTQWPVAFITCLCSFLFIRFLCHLSAGPRWCTIRSCGQPLTLMNLSSDDLIVLLSYTLASGD